MRKMLLSLYVVVGMGYSIPGTAVAEGTDLSLKAAKITAVDDAWRANLPTDPAAATAAYLQRLSPSAQARSDAYFEGGYWLLLWNFLLTMATSWLLLGSRFSARLRDWVERRTRFKFLQLIYYAAIYIVAIEVLSLPLTIYEGFFREHSYGLANQTFAPWFGELLTGYAIAIVLGSVAIASIYTVIRKAPSAWPVWGTVIWVVLMMFTQLIAPLYIDPLFNTYKPLAAGQVRESILSLARANGIEAKDVYEFDASRQSDRVSANVSGFMNTLSIRLNDNLLKRGTPSEVKAVMGHEMGHYVMNHIYKGIAEFSLVIFFGFVFVRAGFEWLRSRFARRWEIRSIADLAGIPLMAALLSVFLFVLTPILNTIVRTQEAEADMFGLNAAGEPDAWAESVLKLTEYRKANPTAFEEFMFFDHPSARNRIFMAMRWKAENRVAVVKAL